MDMHGEGKLAWRVPRRRGLSLALAGATLLLDAPPVAAVTYGPYSEILSGRPTVDFSGSDGAYPGRIFVANRTRDALCVWQAFKGADGTVLKQTVGPIYVGPDSGATAIQGPGDATATIQFLLFYALYGHCNWKPFLQEAIHIKPTDSTTTYVSGQRTSSFSFDGSQWSAKREIHITVKGNP